MKGAKVVEVLKVVGRYAGVVAGNGWRCLAIVGRYMLICWQQQKLRRTLRLLGTQVFQAREAGEVNPMLTEAVKDTLTRAQDLKAIKDQQYQAIAELREKMRAAWASARGATPPPEPPEASAEGAKEESVS